MTPHVRTILWAHAIASWATSAVLWFDTLRQPGCPPLDRQFWLIFGVTEGLAPIWLPLSYVVYRPGLGPTVMKLGMMYLVFAAVSAAWRWPRERQRLILTRRAEGRCIWCGYDVRATPEQCPECGKVPSAVANGSSL